MDQNVMDTYKSLNQGRRKRLIQIAYLGNFKAGNLLARYMLSLHKNLKTWNLLDGNFLGGNPSCCMLNVIEKYKYDQIILAAFNNNKLWLIYIKVYSVVQVTYFN